MLGKFTESFLASNDTSSLNLLRQMRASRSEATPSSLSEKLRTAMAVRPRRLLDVFSDPGNYFIIIIPVLSSI